MLLVLALVTVALACGGDEGPGRDAYRARADEIRAAGRAKTAPLVQRLTTAARSLTAARAPGAGVTARRLQAVAERYVAQLRALEQPSGDREQIEAFLGPAERLVDAAGSAAGALERREVVRAIGVVGASQALVREAEAAAADYGLEQCHAFAALAPS